MLRKAVLSILISLLAALLLSVCFNSLGLYSQNWWWSLLLHFVISICLKLGYSYKTDVRSFIGVLLGSFSVKLLLLMVAFFLYTLHDKRGIFNFSLHFIAHYILFTVFEMRYLLTLIKNKKP